MWASGTDRSIKSQIASAKQWWQSWRQKLWIFERPIILGPHPSFFFWGLLVTRMGRETHLSSVMWELLILWTQLLFLLFSYQVMSNSATPWTVACQTPLLMRFSRQENWNGLPFPPPGDLPYPGNEPMSLASPALAGGLLTTEPLGKPMDFVTKC